MMMVAPASPAMATLSTKRPSLSPLKRKLSTDDEPSSSPTSMDEEPTDESVISPKKKVKAESAITELNKWETNLFASISSALDLDDLEIMDLDLGESEISSSSFAPIPVDQPAADPLAAEELEILNFFLA